MNIPPNEATDALAAARTTMARSRRAVVERPMRVSLVYWGLVMMVGYPTVRFLPVWLPLLLWGLLLLGPSALCWLRKQRGALSIISGWERAYTRAWWVFVLGSIAIGWIVAPAPLYVVPLLIGMLWGLALLLYAAVVADREVGLVGIGMMALAVALRVFVPEHAILIFGLAAGGGMTLLGLVRIRWSW